MRPITESEIRASFVNCTKGEAKRLSVPRNLDTVRFDELDFLGWQDGAAPERAYLVADHDATLTGIALRRASGGSGRMRRTMCSLCLTTHTTGGVALMTARRPGKRGQQGDSVGIYLCSDLACSLYLRGRKEVWAAGRFEESMTVEEKVARLTANLTGFLTRLTT